MAESSNDVSRMFPPHPPNQSLKVIISEEWSLPHRPNETLKGCFQWQCKQNDHGCPKWASKVWAVRDFWGLPEVMRLGLPEVMRVPDGWVKNNQGPFQEPKLEVSTIYKAYIRFMELNISTKYGLIWYSTSILGSWNSHWNKEEPWFP